ncbi:MAG: LTA synthase family protein, partial [Bacteroidales bacterium]
MKSQLLYTLKLALYVLLLFTLGRLSFMLIYVPLFVAEQPSFGELLNVFIQAIPLDISTFSYIYIFIYLLLLLSAIFPGKVWKPIGSIYTLCFTLVYTLIFAGEIGIYGEWRTKLNYKALLYLQHPSEVFNSIATWQFLSLCVFVVLFVCGMGWLYQKYVATQFIKRGKWYFILIYFLVTPGLWLIAARGGVGQIPISQSQSFFSNKQILNDVCANPAWNLIHNIANSRGILEKNPYTFYPQNEALQTVASIYATDSTLNGEITQILTTPRPNIVIILLESWSADVIQHLSGDSTNYTPCFQALEKESLFFTECYSGGKRSQQGIASIYAGFPALPQIVITNYPEKSRKLPSWVKYMKAQGYHTSFYFGGELIYGNILSFLHANDFDQIVEQKNLKNLPFRGKLGYHDQYMFAEYIKALNKTPEPFFSTLFTLSSHTPYDQPMARKFNQNIPEIEYLNSVYYTDSCLGAYMAAARKQTWFKNTLFIVVADHSHTTHKQTNYYSFANNHIPMLFFGEVLKPQYRGSTCNKLISQNDIVATILGQMQLPSKAFPWSRNIFHP